MISLGNKLTASFANAFWPFFDWKKLNTWNTALNQPPSGWMRPKNHIANSKHSRHVSRFDSIRLDFVMWTGNYVYNNSAYRNIMHISWNTKTNRATYVIRCVCIRWNTFFTDRPGCIAFVFEKSSSFNLRFT